MGLRSRHPLLALTFAGGLVGLWLAIGGCAGSEGTRVYDYPTMARETFTVGTPQMVLGGEGRSRRVGESATDSDAGDVAADRSVAAPGGRAWWVDRNDGYLNVRQRSGLVRSESVVIINDDRQRSHDGEIHNTHRRRSISVERGGFLYR